MSTWLIFGTILACSADDVVWAKIGQLERIRDCPKGSVPSQLVFHARFLAETSELQASRNRLWVQ